MTLRSTAAAIALFTVMAAFGQENAPRVHRHLPPHTSYASADHNSSLGKEREGKQPVWSGECAIPSTACR